MIRRLLFRSLREALTWALILLMSFPLLWMVLTALKAKDETTSFPRAFWPVHWTLEHFHALLFHSPFLRYFANSLAVAAATTLLCVVFAVLGAHALTRYRFPGRNLVARLVLFTYLLPAAVLLVPLYVVIARLGLAGSLTGLVITYTTFALPFALWLLRAFMAALPPDVGAAATLDGAGRLAVLFEIVLPQAWPGVAATAVFTFIAAYNEYLYALVFINRDALKTLPTGVMVLVSESFTIDWNLLMAASCMITLPILALFLLVQKHLGRGIAAGSVKG